MSNALYDRDFYEWTVEQAALLRGDRLGTLIEQRTDVIPGGGHLNDGTGFTTFPQLRDAILATAAG